MVKLEVITGWWAGFEVITGWWVGFEVITGWWAGFEVITGWWAGFEVHASISHDLAPQFEVAICPRQKFLMNLSYIFLYSPPAVNSP